MNEEENTALLARMDELIDHLALESTPDWSDEYQRAQVVAVYAGTITLFNALYGKSSNQAKALFESRKAFTKTQYNDTYELRSFAESLLGFLQNLREEVTGGLIRDLRTEAKGEVLGDLVAGAKQCLSDGNVQTASVLACACLEDALKRKAEELGTNVENKTMSSVINALKAKSFFSGPQGPLVSSFVKLRNAAMHADWKKIGEPEVASLVGFLEPFLVKHFS
jgi:hypothetical protein